MIRLNLGSGYRKFDGYVNIDNRSECEPNLLCDVTQGLPFDDSSVDEVRAYDFLEHIHPDKIIHVIEEIWRVLKPGGRFEHFTPTVEHGVAAFMDLHHRSFFCKNTWIYFTDDDWRALYGTKAKFGIDKLEDVCTNEAMKIVHTHGVFYAAKD